jgi:polyferredoxin
MVLFHTAFRFGGIVSISFWSMVAVVLSGIIGRFIYLQIPRSIEGNELSQDEMSRLNIELKFKLKEDYQLESSLISSLDENSINKKDEIKITQVLNVLIVDILETRKKISAIRKYLKNKSVPSHKQKEILKISKSKLLLSRKILLLKSMQKLFGYWHVFHLPFAIIMLIIMVVHVGIAVTFGYTWVF